MGKQILNGVVYGDSGKYIELTQAEYNALPDTKYTDGIVYFIKDADFIKNLDEEEF